MYYLEEKNNKKTTNNYLDLPTCSSLFLSYMYLCESYNRNRIKKNISVRKTHFSEKYLTNKESKTFNMLNSVCIIGVEDLCLFKMCIIKSSNTVSHHEVR